MVKPVVAITIGKSNYERMFNQESLQKLNSFCRVIEHEGPDPATKEDLLQLLPEADACITSWDVACLDDDVIAAAPKLKAIAHMGGSIARYTSPALWDRDIKVFSTAVVLAQGVAETTLGLMIIGMKRIPALAQHVRNGGWRDSDHWPAREIHGKTIGVVAASNVGRHMLRLLQAFSVDVLLYDPFVSDEEAKEMGAAKVELDELVRRSDLITMHAPSKPATRHMLNAEHFKVMKDNAVIVNTARGSLLDEEALIAELRKGRFYALLDVCDPEPPAADSPLRSLENVLLVPHIAGCIENCSQLSEMAAEELRRFFAGEKLINLVTHDMLKRIS